MMRRTTISANAEALSTLAAEAKRRGTSLSALIAESVSEKAAATRERRTTRTGVARSTDGRRASELGSQPIARPSLKLVALVLDTDPLLAARDLADPDRPRHRRPRLLAGTNDGTDQVAQPRHCSAAPLLSLPPNGAFENIVRVGPACQPEFLAPRHSVWATQSSDRRQACRRSDRSS